MSLTINTNLSSLITQNSLRKSTFDLNKAIEQMTTGFRINSAADDAAGYSVATKMETSLSSFDVAKNNAMLGQSLINTASGALDIVTDHLQRIRDLSEQAANGTYGVDSIRAIQAEIDQRLEEINRVMAMTEYNGIKLFEGGGASPIAVAAATPAAQSVTGDFINPVIQLTAEQAEVQGYTIITDRAGLEAIATNPSGKYILMNDIDLSGTEYWRTSIYFSGELNGNGYVIKNMGGGSSLFVSINNAKISNLGIENCNVGNRYCGAIAGEASGSTEIINCYSTGVVDGEGAGGLVGNLYGGTITSSYSTANVSASSCAGGLVGSMSSGTSITNCYATGDVSNRQEYTDVGGLVGYLSGTITNCYSTGLVTEASSSSKGGLIGEYNSGTVANSYYDTTTSGCTDSNGGSQGVTTAELNALIANGTLPKASPPAPTPGGGGGTGNITLQVGITSSENSRISFDTALSIALSVNVSTTTSARNAIADIDAVIDQVTRRQTEFGAVQNRLDSVVESLNVSIENTTSSLSTIKDADIAKVSSDYIKSQILQQASATLLSTANQSPSIALNLI